MSKIDRVQVNLTILLLNYHLNLINTYNSVKKILEELVKPTCFFFLFNSARYLGQFLFQCLTLA